MKNPDDSSSKMFVLAIVAIVVIGIGAIAFFATQRNSAAVAEEEKTASFTADGIEFPADPTEEEAASIIPQIQELALTPVQQGAPDPEIGQKAPELSGTNFAGEPVEIKADGKTKVVYFLAHWCPNCQEDVPEIQELLDDGKLPEGLEIYSVSTQYQPGSGNSPEIWLDRENWTPPVLRDNSISAVFSLYGATGTPAFVYLDGENNILYRGGGALPAQQTLALWEQAANGTLGADSTQSIPQGDITPIPNAEDPTATSTETTPSSSEIDADEGTATTAEDAASTSIAVSTTIG